MLYYIVRRTVVPITPHDIVKSGQISIIDIITIVLTAG